MTTALQLLYYCNAVDADTVEERAYVPRLYQTSSVSECLKVQSPPFPNR